MNLKRSPSNLFNPKQIKGVIMNTRPLFSFATAFTEKLKDFWSHKKKIKALENYSQVGTFQHKHYLFLIKRCLNEGFLGEEESRFLSYMTNKYFPETGHLAWAHKTKWIKGQIKEITCKKPKLVELDMFD